MHITQKILNFLNGPDKKAKIEGDSVSLYLRKGKRYIDGNWYSCVDIASIVVDLPRQGRGYGTNAIKFIHENNPLQVTYIEATGHPLDRWCDREGWTLEPGMEEVNYYKLTAN